MINSKVYFWLVLFIFYFQPIQAQNLVPNYSFESLINLPLKIPKNRSTSTFRFEPSSGYIPYKKNLKHWFAATKTTPDLRIINNRSYINCSKSHPYCIRPKTGNHVVGIITSMQNKYTDSYREYIQIKLGKTLRPGVQTYVELWVVKDHSAKLISNNIGCYFSQKSVYEDTEEVLDRLPQINYDLVIDQAPHGWIQIRDSFIPDKPLRYLVIGNFFNNENTKIDFVKNHNLSPYVPAYAYYLIDDVRVWQDKNQEIVFEEKLVQKNEQIRINNIFFETDEAILLSDSFDELNKLFSFLKNYPAVRISIHGHTDNQGSENYNLNLSNARVKATVDFLTKKGIDPGRMSFKGLGEKIPIESNETKEGRQQNRRVEFVIIEGVF